MKPEKQTESKPKFRVLNMVTNPKPEHTARCSGCPLVDDFGCYTWCSNANYKNDK